MPPFSPRTYRSLASKTSRTDIPSVSNANNNSNSNNNNNNSSSEYDSYDTLGAPVEVHRVPADQLTNLTEEQKNEVFTKVITAVNPNVTKNITRFDYTEGTFKAVNTVSHLATHFQMEGFLIYNDSEEAKEQQQWIKENKDRVMSFKSTGTSHNNADEPNSTPPMSPNHTHSHTAVSMGTDTADDDQDGSIVNSAPSNDRALKNQFNYSERGNQTVNNTMRDREVCTEPPPCVDFNGQVTHWEIFDTYCEHLEKELSQREAKEKTNKKRGITDEEDEEEQQQRVAIIATITAQTSLSLPHNNTSTLSSSSSPGSAELDNIFHSPSCALALKTIERLINQNSEATAFYDYKYFDDVNTNNNNNTSNNNNNPTLTSNTTKSKETVTTIKKKTVDKTQKAISPSTVDRTILSPIPAKGSFLPLWKFNCPSNPHHLSITCIKFNPLFSDLFGVSFGSYEFHAQHQNQRGMILCYSLKNVGYPEYCIDTPSPVQSIDFHPQYPALLCAGMYDGSVSVYDIRHRSQPRLYASEDPKVKHTDCVWQVRWQSLSTDEMTSDKPLSFYSISADGRITTWEMNKNELKPNDLITLTVKPNDTANHIAATTLVLNTANDTNTGCISGGSCFDFNKHFPHLFVAGTEEGSIHLYNTAYNTRFVRQYLGHHMGVYAVHFNPFHPGVFLSCSADWQVKLWEIESTSPVMTFDLNTSVSDVAWSPYCSTMFAVVTGDGKLRVYDLARNKHEPIGEVRVGKKNQKVTQICFSRTEPIVCVGDEQGTVTVLKLSASMRREATWNNNNTSNTPALATATTANTSAPPVNSVGNTNNASDIDALEECYNLDRLLVVADRPIGRIPEYLQYFIHNEERKRAGREKARAAEKAAIDKANAAAGGSNGATSPLGSPKAKTMMSPRGD